MDEDVVVFNAISESTNKLTKEKEVLSNYTQSMKFRDLIELQKEPQLSVINLTFEMLFDMRTPLEFVPIIYQEKSSLQTHHLLIFSFDKMKIVRRTSLLSNLQIRKTLK